MFDKFPDKIRNMKNAVAVTVTLALISLQSVNCNKYTHNIADDESCYSYGPDRHVYPQGNPTSDHKLQYTKAVS